MNFLKWEDCALFKRHINVNTLNKGEIRREFRMKRFFATLLVAVMLLSMLPAASMAATQYATVVGGWLRLRSAANFNADTITSYYTGTVVEILGSTGGWYRVETPDGRVGYMYGQYLELNKGSSHSSGSGSAYIYSHNGQGVRLRVGPGTGYRVIGTFNPGTPVTILERGSTWSRVSINGTVGYMMTQYLSSSHSGGGSSYDKVICYATIWSSNGYGVRLRSGPSKSYEKIGVYSVGTTVAVLEKGSVWDRIRVGSREGWMMNEFLNYYSSNEVNSVTLNNYDPAVGNILAVQAISPSRATVTYEWRVDGVTKSTKPTYTVTYKDVGKVIQLKVTGVGAYTGSAKSPVTNRVVSDTVLRGVKLNTTAPVVGNVLTATLNPEGAKVLYSWKVGGRQVSNAESYTVTQNDIGKKIELTVNGTGAFHGWAQASTEKVSPFAMLTDVTIRNLSNGTAGAVPAVGDTLSAVVSPSQATVYYQWFRNGYPINDAHGATYELSQRDQGSKISVLVYGNGSYHGEKRSAEVGPIDRRATKPVIDDIKLPNAIVGETYASQLSAQGGGEITWKVTRGRLPEGLSLAKIGAITGTPEKAGKSSFTVTAQNAAGTSKSKQFSITVETAAAVAPVITTNYFGNGYVGESYSRTLTAEAQTAVKWTITAGALPQGLNLTDDGVISGVPAAAGNSAFTVTVTDQNGLKASQNFNITIEGPDEEPGVAPVISTNYLSNATVGKYYETKLKADMDVQWNLSRGNTLPEGLTLYADGTISGTPVKAGTSTLIVLATANGQTASKSLALTVEEASSKPANAPEITTTAFGNAKVGEYYERTMGANAQSSVTWSQTGGELPDGFKLSANGHIGGTPEKAGTYTFTVTVTDQNGLSDSGTFTITVEGALPAGPVITTNGFGGGKLGDSYGRQLEAASETSVSWSIISGGLPTGLTMNADGAITGRLEAAGTFPFTVQVMDAYGQTASKSFAITVEEVVVHKAPVITTNYFGDAKVGEHYGRSLTADAETAVRWSLVSGDLPRGLEMKADGTISGTPERDGTSFFTVRVTDENGLHAQKEFSIKVERASATQPEQQRPQWPQWPQEQPEQQRPQWPQEQPEQQRPQWPQEQPEQQRPQWPQNNERPGRDSDSSQQQNEPKHTAPVITTNYFGNAKVGQSYGRQLTAEAETSVIWSIEAGSVPDGLIFKEDGTINGTPTQTGTWYFTVKATDNNDLSVTGEFSITVE